MTVERLSREDRFMLWPDRRWPQVNGALLVLDGRPLSDRAGRFQIDRARSFIESRLERVPRFRQLLYVPPGRLGGPVWVDARQFDVSEHVTEIAVPGPAGEAEVLAVVEELWCRRLDRSRPLWSMCFLTGLPEGRVALFLRIHHAIADGVAAIATFAGLLDTAPDAGPAAAQPWTASPPPSAGELFRDSLRERGAAVRRSVSPLLHPARTFRAVRGVWPALHEVFADQPLAPTSLDAVVGQGHNLAPIRTSLSLMKEIALAHGATVNDVLLALITAGLRRLLSGRGELEPEMVVRISVPVSLRLAERAQARGNLISTMVVPLPVGNPEPTVRLRRIAAETARRKTISRPSMAIFPTNRLLGPLMLKAIKRQRVNVASTNVPGPGQPLYLAGSRILEVLPFLPLIGNEPLAIGAMSYAGQFNIMAVGDRELVPDLDHFAEGMRDELHQRRVELKTERTTRPVPVCS